MLPGMIGRRTSLLCAAVLFALGALSGCRQAPVDPGFRVPSPDETPVPTPARVDFTVPTGFVESYDYHILNPLYPVPVVDFLIPIGSGRDNGEVIGVASYLMDVDVTGHADAQLVARIKGYVTFLKAEASEPVRSTVAGRPAFTTAVKEPSSDGGFYTYDATFIFAGTHLVEVACQYANQKDLVDKACASVLSSLKVVLLA
jgi:hypothetical protein